MAAPQPIAVGAAVAAPRKQFVDAPEGCDYCDRLRAEGSTFHPNHWGSPLCRSNGLAAGGTKAHCTCNACF